MQPKHQTNTEDKLNLFKQQKSQKKKNKLNLFLLTIFNSLVIVLILILLSKPSVQSSLAELLGLKDEIRQNVPQKIDYSQLERVKVNRVVDGDTVILEDSRRVRYLNIDTPESVSPNKPVQCFGKEAFAINQDLVEGKEVWLKFDKEKEDRYNRLLAFVFLPGKNTNDITQSVNAYLVEMGFARTYIIKPNDTYSAEFAKLEREAKKNNRGVWGACLKPFEE